MNKSNYYIIVVFILCYIVFLNKNKFFGKMENIQIRTLIELLSNSNSNKLSKTEIEILNTNEKGN